MGKESLYVDRMFQLFDENNDGFISFEEFLKSVSILSTKGTYEEKVKCKFGLEISIVYYLHMRFVVSFNILDFNADGKLSTDEVLQMLKASATENSLGMKDEHLDMV